MEGRYEDEKGSFVAYVVLIGSTLAFTADGPNDVEQAFAKAIITNDLQAVLALYAPDAVLYPPDAFEVEGIAAIRENYAGLMNNYTIE